MRKAVFVILTMALAPCSFAVDGVVLINQSSVVAAGGFPFKITQSGSYRLSGNLTVSDANTTAISITADNVTLDLNGFSIIGTTVCTGSPAVTSCSPRGNGFGVISFKNSITVVNGSVRGMGDAGIGVFGAGAIVERVTAFSNGNAGFEVQNGTVRGNTANSNGGNGFQVDSSTLTGNTSIGNGGAFQANQCTVSGNTANSNLQGIIIQCPSSVVGNTAFSNGSGANFFFVGAGCAVANNTAP